MNVFKVPDALEHQYKGTGIALAASVDGLLVAIRYLSDIAPDVDATPENLEEVIQSANLAPTVRELQALGDVHIGMCSCWEFIEL